MGLDPVDFRMNVHRSCVGDTLLTPAIIAVFDTKRSRVALHGESVGVGSSPHFEVAVGDEIPLSRAQQFSPSSSFSSSSGVFQQGEEGFHL